MTISGSFGDMTLRQQEPTVMLRILTASLEFWIENSGAEPLRVWDRSNSWGWETFVLVIARRSEPQECFTLKPKPRIWTRNGPGFVEIPPRGGHLVTMRPGNPEWDGLQCIDHLRDETLLVQGLLRILPSPEARRFNVFVGEVTSPTYVSEPPHAWLFGNP